MMHLYYKKKNLLKNIRLNYNKLMKNKIRLNKNYNEFMYKFLNIFGFINLFFFNKNSHQIFKHDG